MIVACRGLSRRAFAAGWLALVACGGCSPDAGTPLSTACAAGDPACSALSRDGGSRDGCVPTRCQDRGIECGPADDGCGGMLDCGGCTAPKTCGGDGTPGRCGCAGEDAAKLCAAAGHDCGTLATKDRCGFERIVQCGACTAPSTCGGGGTAGRCGCVAEGDALFCARFAANCGMVQGKDLCGVPRSVDCGTCRAPESCGGAGTPNVCGCTGEDDAALCAQLGANCSTLAMRDRCGRVRAVSCGVCGGRDTCGGGGKVNVCGCTPESNPAFCARLLADCGTVIAMDSCGLMRMVSCGTCEAPLTCGGAGAPNQCGCRSEDDTSFCVRVGANCGIVAALDNCGRVRSVDCGGCMAPRTCGGGGVPHACGCTGDSDAALCATAKATCGVLATVDNCGAQRMPDCGSCSAPLTCGGGGVAHVCGCTPETASDFCKRLGGTCGALGGADNCGVPRVEMCGICNVGLLCDANRCVLEPEPPRLVRPISSSLVTSHQPALRFVLAPNTDSAKVQVCADRACNSVLATLFGKSSVTAPDLARGTYFWRAFGRRGALEAVTVVSPTWSYVVSERSSVIDTAWGSLPDIEGDGIGDLVISANLTASGGGSIYLLLSTNKTITLTYSNTGAYGALVHTGDLDGDGWLDVIAVDNWFNRIVVKPGGPKLPGAYASVALNTGARALAVGDFDGNGYADLAVALGGQIVVYRGGFGGVDAGRTWTLTSPRANDTTFGYTLAATDFDGDGLVDLATTATQAPPRVYVYNGNLNGLGNPPSATIDAPAPQGNWATGVWVAGDTNGDGRGDLIVGGGAFAQSGAISLLVGSPKGLDPLPVAELESAEPDYVTDYYGMSNGAAGDVDRDGYDDILIGATGTNHEIGRVFLAFGGPKGLAPRANIVLDGPDAVSQHFGFAMTGFDLNHDGYSDLVISAPSRDVRQSMLEGCCGGILYEFYGGKLGPAAVPDVRVQRRTNSDRSFGFAVAHAQ